LRNLNSILQQDYKNYHIIYIDDASKDGTAEKVNAYIQKYNVSDKRLNFIENTVNKKALPNIDYAARRLCKSGEIMAIIDGDDYLIGTQVFKLINARYQH
jgi:glycosyltransferase involved in cell wall biosynthesis